MKRLLTICLLALSLQGCSSFLNVETLGKSTIDGFFGDTDGLKAAGLGLHSLIRDYYDDYYIRMGEIAADKIYLYRVNTSQVLQLVYDFESLPADNSGYPYLLWKKGYEICTNANNILFYGEKLLKEFPEHTDLINKHFAYAYFARALAIFDLCNIYAMPYIFTADASHLGVVAIDYVPGFDSELPRDSVKDCYNLILSDLKKAIELFGEDTERNPTYISALACKALLARVYLYMKDYSNAAAYAKEVMNEVPLSPRSEYVNMFRKAQDFPGEAIFRVNSYSSGSGMRAFCSPLTDQTATIDPEFLATFSSDDVRKDLFTYVAEPEDGDIYAGKVFTAICKYLPLKGGVSDELNRRCDPFILRVSEMYFIHAEALCLGGGNLNEAAEDIKAIRARALGKSPSDIGLNYTGADGLDRIIQEERAKELCFEGHRFFDLKRRGEDIVRSSGTSSTTKVLRYPDYRYSLPISQMEMQANDKMEQNDGYKDK
ncbi:MAG: RagB/SusD family nutrient uptake outer membrane protein [Bacteroidales bacterium]|nr:RagB/SusD family nutrient uptake outer membrane protein [Bacteroidales bacterium]